MAEMTEGERKHWIDNASYEALLRLWRFEPPGSPWFTGYLGEYFATVMVQRRSKLSKVEMVEASMRVGWRPETRVPLQESQQETQPISQEESHDS